MKDSGKALLLTLTAAAAVLYFTKVPKFEIEKRENQFVTEYFDRRGVISLGGYTVVFRDYKFNGKGIDTVEGGLTSGLGFVSPKEHYLSDVALKTAPFDITDISQRVLSAAANIEADYNAQEAAKNKRP